MSKWKELMQNAMDMTDRASNKSNKELRASLYKAVEQSTGQQAADLLEVAERLNMDAIEPKTIREN